MANNNKIRGPTNRRTIRDENSKRKVYNNTNKTHRNNIHGGKRNSIWK